MHVFYLFVLIPNPFKEVDVFEHNFF